MPIGDVLFDDEIEKYFNCRRDDFKDTPKIVCVVAGVRGGKSILSAAAAVKSCLTADLSALLPYEVPRCAIVAPREDNAKQTFSLLLGALRNSKLASLIVGEPTSDTIRIRRDDGRIVEIVVVAASSGAVTLRSRWLVGFVLDEVALFGAESTGAVVNAEELLRGAETRLVPGGQGWLISSPFGPSGLLYDLWRHSFGKPDRYLVVHAPTRALNPSFPAETVDAIRKRTPDVAAREYDAQWIDADTAFFDGSLIDAATRKGPMEEGKVFGARYIAAWDAATRGNSWTLVVARAEWVDQQERVTIACARQWTGSKVAPLDPSVVIGEIATTLQIYGVRQVHCDAWGADALQSISRTHGLQLLVASSTTAGSFARYDKLRTLVATGCLSIPPDDILVHDLKNVRKRALSNGVRIDLPRTADGRHCDYAPSMALIAEYAPLAVVGTGSSGGTGIFKTKFGSSVLDFAVRS